MIDASECFIKEADILDQGDKILGWPSPEGPDTIRNSAAISLLSKARDSYISGIEKIESALKIIE